MINKKRLFVVILIFFFIVQGEHKCAICSEMNDGNIEITEEYVKRQMFEYLVKMHDEAVCIVNNEKYHPLNDGYDPWEDYSFYCILRDYTNEYGHYKYWDAFAFVHGMPYMAILLQFEIDCPDDFINLSGNRLGLIPASDGFTYKKGDDIQAALIVLQENQNVRNYIIEKSLSSTEVVFRIDIDNELKGNDGEIWISGSRLIPVCAFPSDSADDSDPILLYVLIRINRKSIDSNYCWEITIFSQDAISPNIGFFPYTIVGDPICKEYVSL